MIFLFCIGIFSRCSFVFNFTPAEIGAVPLNPEYINRGPHKFLTSFSALIIEEPQEKSQNNRTAAIPAVHLCLIPHRILLQMASAPLGHMPASHAGIPSSTVPHVRNIACQACMHHSY